MNITMLRRPKVSQTIAMSRSATYNLIAEGLFPPGVKLSTRAVAWPEHEVNQVLSARIAGKSDDEIRQLVRDLVAKRKEFLL